MKLAIDIVNAFAKGAFTGNPAAVIVTSEPLAEKQMQQIAAQNNLAETAFVVTGSEPYWLRWFTPVTEVDLCGHATLAAAFVLFERGLGHKNQLVFNNKSGPLGVTRQGDQLVLDFPARPAVIDASADFQHFARALGCGVADIDQCLIANWRVVVLKSEAALRDLRPDFTELAKLHNFAVMATAPGTEVDFCARFFAPNAGIDEDPVTGSAYTTLAPYWALRLNKKRLTARQLSLRSGWLTCEDKGERVLIGGSVEAYLRGDIDV